MTQAREFTRVYRDGRRLSAGWLQIIHAPATLEHARLGLAIPKRILPRAVDRNAVKRRIRESFRHHAAALPAVDCVVTLRGRQQRALPADFTAQINRLWLQLAESQTPC